MILKEDYLNKSPIKVEKLKENLEQQERLTLSQKASY